MDVDGSIKWQISHNTEQDGGGAVFGVDGCISRKPFIHIVQQPGMVFLNCSNMSWYRSQSRFRHNEYVKYLGAVGMKRDTGMCSVQ